VPTSTDLVKDGAVAIETLGDSIDASLVDLKGGTTGQVLAKASGTDMDFSWVAIDPLVILDAKGDLITATAADTPARLAVGTNAQVLTADSTTATGLKWATPAATTPTFVGAGIYASAQTITKGTYAKIAYANEDYDTNTFHDNATNNTRMTVPTGYGGKYLINAIIQMPSAVTTQAVVLFKNGSRFIQDGIHEGWIQTVAGLSNNDAAGVGGSIVLDAVATDYFEIACYVDGSGTATLSNSRFDFVFLGA
jgi:hypothetical protein